MVGIKIGCFKDLIKSQSFRFVGMSQTGIKRATLGLGVKFRKYVSTERIRLFLKLLFGEARDLPRDQQ